jgi:hypothetical protein
MTLVLSSPCHHLSISSHQSTSIYLSRLRIQPRHQGTPKTSRIRQPHHEQIHDRGEEAGSGNADRILGGFARSEAVGDEFLGWLDDDERMEHGILDVKVLERISKMELGPPSPFVAPICSPPPTTQAPKQSSYLGRNLPRSRLAIVILVPVKARSNFGCRWSGLLSPTISSSPAHYASIKWEPGYDNY